MSQTATADGDCGTTTPTARSGIESVRDLPHVDAVERTTKYDWSDREYWRIATTPGAYSCENCLTVLLDLNVVEDNGDELLVPVGDVFQH